MQFRDRDLFRQAAWIDGREFFAGSGAVLEVTNPADDSVVGTVPCLGAAETSQAIAAAAAALPGWRGRTALARGETLRRWAGLLGEHRADLARIMTLESGKVLRESEGEVEYAASFLDWFAGEGPRAYGETVPAHRSDARIVVVKEPVGVVAAITPWNFPAAMITRKVGPALAAGCTMILKPAEQTPFTAIALAVLAERAGVPAGVFNVVTGDPRAIGGEITRNPTVRKLSFTGSTPVGKLLLSQCADTVKRISLELGGNAPFLVFDDADLGSAVQGALDSKFRNSGQTCVCTNRFLVEDGIYDAFATRLAERVGALKVGDGLDPGNDQGPLIEAAAIEKVEAHVADALASGGRLLCGGHRHPRGGNFFEPTVLADATPAMRCAQEETFGPVAALFRFRGEAEALRLANDTQYGLAAYCYTRDLGRAWRMLDGLECGMVGINAGLISTAVAPFGGIKESGVGREGSRHGIDEYLEIKYALLGDLDAESSSS